MNYVANHNKLRLCSRSEGKIKSYESCHDVRAWSHDVRARDLYLREWIKSDMPNCVYPTGTLAKFMRTMTYRSRGRVAPRCHPDCKSKVVLESICKSCHAMKECLKNEDNFEKYFNDEDFETSHWPCEQCLEALKSIKMFWRIIIEKIFNVTIPKDNLGQTQSCGTDNVRSVVSLWQSEMTQQAIFVKNISHLNDPSNFTSTCPCDGDTMNKESLISEPNDDEDHKNGDMIRRNDKQDRSKATDTDCLTNNSSRRSSSTNGQKRSRCSKMNIKMVDVGCHCNEYAEEMETLKANLQKLEQKCDCQNEEIDKLKRENSSLKIELQNVYKNGLYKSTILTSSRCTSSPASSSTSTKPRECCSADENVAQLKQVKGVDSEMIITMKNGKNEAYRHISLLQVLHKTNCPDLRDFNLGTGCSSKNKDPIDLLTKVQNTFGAIVKREMGKACERESQSIKCAIDTSYSQVNAGTTTYSQISCTTNTFTSSDSYFTNGVNTDSRPASLVS